ncbi:MAG TPA: c-type cytochrome [Pyrinomonadaceae bacterium]|nr:c-type cytochrome [Pyrinomonadaceae bacterium]
MSKRRSILFVISVALLLASEVLISKSGSANNSTINLDTKTATAQVFDQEVKLAELRKQIAGKEQMPAETVFKNIQFLKGVPAGRLLAVMKIGYSRSLGVTCTHCHVVDQWEKDDKPTKQTARDMAQMVRTINNDLLKNIKNLKSESPVINCTTCHRGQTKPALDLAEPPKS